MNTSSLITKLSIAALRFRFVKPALAASVLLAAALGGNAQAQDNWNGGATDNFSDLSGWSNGSPNGQQITFANFLGTGGSTYSLNDDLSDVGGDTFNGIFINGPSSVTLSGNAFTLATTGNGIQLNSPGTLTINNNITLTDSSDSFVTTTGGGTEAIVLNGNITGAGTTVATSVHDSANGTLTFSTGTVTLAGLNAGGNVNLGTGNYSTNPNVIFSNSTLNVSGGVTVGRGNLVFEGTTVANITGSISNSSASADWGSVVIQDSANVTASSLNMTTGSTATGQALLLGGTLTTGSIATVDREGGAPATGGSALLVFNGTQIVSSASSSTFVAVTPGYLGSNQAYIGTSGLLFNTAGFTDTIGTTLNDLTSTLVTADSNTSLTAPMAGSGFLTKSGAGALTLTAANTYSGGTTVTGGTLYVNNSTGSGTGSGAVLVQTGGTLAGNGTISGAVTVQSGGVIASGAAQTNVVSPTNPTGVDTVTGHGLTVDLAVNGGATLQFDLGAGPSTGYLNYASPNLNSTSLTSTGPVAFGTTGGNVNVSLVDLTAFSASDTLQLRVQNPYLLISAGSDSAYNLVTTGGYDQNGLVLGIGSSGTGSTVLNGFTLSAQDINGNGLVVPYNNLQLYLYNGQLEVIPEPGTWALMLGGLALLVLVQRRRRDHSA